MNRRRFITLLLVVVAIAVAFALPALRRTQEAKSIRAMSTPPSGRCSPPGSHCPGAAHQEVYSSLFIGIVFGALLYAEF